MTRGISYKSLNCHLFLVEAYLVKTHLKHLTFQTNFKTLTRRKLRRRSFGLFTKLNGRQGDTTFELICRATPISFLFLNKFSHFLQMMIYTMSKSSLRPLHPALSNPCAYVSLSKIRELDRGVDFGFVLT